MLPGGTGTTNLTARRGKSACAKVAVGIAVARAAVRKAKRNVLAVRGRSSHSSLGRLCWALEAPLCNVRGVLSLGDNRAPRALQDWAKPAICARRASGQKRQ